MGFAIERFEEQKINSELICAICDGVFLKPKMLEGCEHLFCQDCLGTLTPSETHENGETFICPIDQKLFELSSVREPFRFFVKLYGALVIRCEFENCCASIPLSELEEHERDCEHNPANIVFCPKVCGIRLNLKDLDTHNCGEYFHSEIRALKVNLEEKEEKNRNEFQELCSVVGELKDVVASLLDELNELKEGRVVQGPAAQSTSSQPINEPSQRNGSSTNKEELFENFKSKLTLEFVPNEHDSSATLWEDDSVFKLLATMTKSPRIREILHQTDLRCFYGPNIRKKLFENVINQVNFMVTLQLIFLEYIEPLVSSGKRVLWIAPDEYGFSTILAQIAKQVTAAVKPEFLPIFNDNFQSLKPRLSYIKSAQDYYLQKKNIRNSKLNSPTYDLIVSFCWFSFMDYKLFIYDFARHGNLLCYNKVLTRVEFGEILNGNGDYVFDVLMTPEQLRQICSVQILKMETKWQNRN